MTLHPTPRERRGPLPSTAQWFRDMDTGQWHLVPIDYGGHGAMFQPVVTVATPGGHHPAVSAPVSAPLAAPGRRPRFGPHPSARSVAVSVVAAPLAAVILVVVGGLGIGAGVLRDAAPYLAAVLAVGVIVAGFAVAVGWEDAGPRRAPEPEPVRPEPPVRPVPRVVPPPPPARLPPARPKLPPAARALPHGDH